MWQRCERMCRSTTAKLRLFNLPTPLGRSLYVDSWGSVEIPSSAGKVVSVGRQMWIERAVTER